MTRKVLPETAKPTREAVIEWLERTGRTQGEAVDLFWPSAVGGERSRLETRVRQWVRRARAKGASVAAGARGPEPAGPGPAPVASNDEGDDVARAADIVRKNRTEFLEWQLAGLVADLIRVRSIGAVKFVAQLSSEIGSVRSELDLARSLEGNVVSLERSPAAVAAEVERRQRRIAELSARARVERDL